MPDWLFTLLLTFAGGVLGGFVVYELSHRGRNK